MPDNEIGYHTRTILLLLQSQLDDALEAAERGNWELCIDRTRIAKAELDHALRMGNTEERVS